MTAFSLVFASRYLDPGEAIDASITFLTALTELLVTLIGERLSNSLVLPRVRFTAGDREHTGFLLRDDDPAAPTPLSEATARFRRLLTALRLYDPLRVALGPVAWQRTGGGAWSIGGLGTSGRPNGVLLVEEAAEDELRAFCNLVARRTPRSGELAWALRRYELGCERTSAFETLTDHLLALRALLEPEGPQPLHARRGPGQAALEVDPLVLVDDHG